MKLQSFHLVVEEGLSGTIYIEAWRDQARRVSQIAKDGKILKVTNLTIKAMGDKAAWQCTDLDLYGSVVSSTKLEEIEDNNSCPAEVHIVLLRDLPMHKQISHLVHLAGVFMETQPSSSTKATAPSCNLVVTDEV